MKSLQELKQPKTVILNIEANGLDPDQIWVVTCIDVDTKEEHIFRRPDLDATDFTNYLIDVARVIGHNIINYDWPVLSKLCGIHEVGLLSDVVCDTLVISRLLDFDRSGGHSLGAWAPTLGVEKTEQPPWDAFSEALVEHSMQNCRLTLALYNRFLPYINSKRWASSIELEHFICVENREIHLNGFHFNVDKARELRYTINIEVEKFDEELLTAFPPKVVCVREVVPRLTKYGTFNRNDFRWEGPDLSEYNGYPFSRIAYEDFNPGSPSQIVERLNEAGWKPTEKTKGHKLFLRSIKRKKLTPEEKEKLAKYTRMGWMVSEKNLDTLPDTAPLAARLLAKRIKYASRVRTLTEWINSVKEDGRIHGTVNGLGAWTHRCSHDKPNTGNIPKGNPKRPETTPFADEMRGMWDVEEGGGYLVGVDAESIQLRVLAHYINDERFTHSLVSGKKEDGTDPHSLNKIALGDPCKSRDDSKTFIYAWLLGAGREQVGHILQCSLSEAAKADEDFVEFYPGLKLLKQRNIPLDAARGYFEGLDGRYIKIRGEDEDQRRHFALAGYLQGGEVIIMKTAMKIWIPKLRKERIPFKLVNFVHDEWQTQVPDTDTAHYVGKVQADSIREAGEILNLRCPMAGSTLSGHGGLAIGQNWSQTH